MDFKESVWIEKYRPKTLEEYITTDSFKQRILSWVDGSNMEHLLFESPDPGTGKTTLAKIIGESISGSDGVLFLNASKDRGIDTIRETIDRFVSSYSINGTKKTVIMDEVDQISFDAKQSLKSLLETAHSTTRFILTCNDVSQITQPLQDRCVLVNFRSIASTDEERSEIKVKAFKFLTHVLREEGIEFDVPVLKELVKMSFYSNCFHFRHAVKCIHEFSKNGRLVLGDFQHHVFDLSEMILAIKSNSFEDLMQFVKNNVYKWPMILEELYKNCDTYFKPKEMMSACVLMSAYQDYIYRGAIKEIPVTAMLFELREFLK